MPKILIKSLPLGKSFDILVVLKKLGNDLAETMDIELDQMVLLYEEISANHFLFKGKTADTLQKSTHHPMVEVTAVKGMPEHIEKQMVLTIAHTLSRELAVDFTNICVTVNNLEPGKLFVFGKFKEQPVKSA